MNKIVTINGIDYPVYADIDDAQKYNNAIVGSKWEDKSEIEQSQLLVMATRKIDSYGYGGKKISDDQPLKFPRVMSNGKVSDEELITYLCCQIATFYSESGSGSSASSDFMNSIEKYQIGDLHVEFKDNANLDLAGLDDYINQALREWILSNMEIWL